MAGRVREVHGDGIQQMAALEGAAIWKQEGERKREAVQKMFGEIAPSYDRLNGLMSLTLDKKWRQIAVDLLELHEGDSALDLCCGTGAFLPLLRKAVGPSGRVFGADFSQPMLQIASAAAPKTLALADTCRLPFANSSVHAVSIGWGIRNVADVDEAHREVFRVLRPGGRFVSVDMARPKNGLVRFASEAMFRTLVPAVGTLFGKSEAYRYLPNSTLRFKTREQLVESMQRAGFIDVTHRDLMLGNICLHFGLKPKEAPIS